MDDSITNTQKQIKDLVDKIKDQKALDYLLIETEKQYLGGANMEVQITTQYNHLIGLELIKREEGDEKKFYSGSFMYSGAKHDYNLENYHLILNSVRIEFEFDEKCHLSEAHPSPQELLREFGFFKFRKNEKVVLIRHGYDQRRGGSQTEYVQKRVDELSLLLKQLEDSKSSLATIYNNYLASGKKHFVAFWGYKPENRHIREHTCLGEKKDGVSTTKVKLDKREIFFYMIPYDIDVINEAFKDELDEPLAFV